MLLKWVELTLILITNTKFFSSEEINKPNFSFDVFKKSLQDSMFQSEEALRKVNMNLKRYIFQRQGRHLVTMKF